MLDREIVAAIVKGDPAGLAAAYDQYAQGLYDYCRSLLSEPADAADAVQDTFIVASAKVSALREPDRLRAWLYAVARNECHRRLRARARTSSAPLDEAAETASDAEDPEADAEHAELRDLVRAALAGLNPGEREIIELNLRYGLAGADLADALGVSRNQAHALASRARSQFETSLGVLLVARTGREFCSDLAGLLEGWDGQLTVLLRKRLHRHIQHCGMCGERKRRELSPAMLLGLLPVAMLPESLRERVVHLVADVTQGSLAYRARVVHRAGTFANSGFPPQVSPMHLPRWRSKVVRAAGATAAVGAVLGGTLLFLPHHHTGPGTAAGPQPGSSGSAGVGPSASASASGSRSGSRPGSGPGPGSAPGRSAGAPGSAPQPGSQLVVASAQPAPPLAGQPPPPYVAPSAAPPPAPSAPPPQPAPAPAPSTAPPGTLLCSPRLIQVGLAITLTAQGGPVNYSISVPVLLSVSSSSGSLQAGQSVNITVSLAPGHLLTGNVTLTVYPGPTTVIVVPLGL
jgi:RNA polymerase sigma factor (sigma-70 family)